MIVRALTLLLIVLVAFVAASPARAGDADAQAKRLATGTLEERLAAADRLYDADPRSLAEALERFGRKARSADDLAFLVELALGRDCRPLRVCTVATLEDVGPDRAVAELSKALEHEDERRVARAVEALGWLGSDAHLDVLLGVVRGRSVPTAVAAVESVARTAEKRDAPALAAAVVESGELALAPDGAWAVRDLVGSAKGATKLFEALLADQSGPRAEVAQAALDVLAADGAKPHRWKTDLGKARKLLIRAPSLPRIESGNPENVQWMQQSLGWLREHAPGRHWLFRAVVRRLDSGDVEDTEIDLGAAAIHLDWDDAGLPPERFSVLVSRIAGVFWRDVMGEPTSERRGWRQSITDDYPLCAAAKLYGADEEGSSLTRHVEQVLGWRPWRLKLR